tara:strand:+ start:4403 stop:4642 length:240 start_codon:yes stop_codon:yes gene_type:complete
MTSVSKEKYKAGKSVQKLLREFEAMELDIDFAAYLLMSAGLTLAMQNNMGSSVELMRLMTASMVCASNNLADEEDETCH